MTAKAQTPMPANAVRPPAPANPPARKLNYPICPYCDSDSKCRKTFRACFAPAFPEHTIQ